jgi:hypothetical protein
LCLFSTHWALGRQTGSHAGLHADRGGGSVRDGRVAARRLLRIGDGDARLAAPTSAARSTCRTATSPLCAGAVIEVVQRL